MSNGFRMGQSMKDVYAKEALDIGCKTYDPCPICFKCKARAVHLYERCTRCQIPLCVHSQKETEHLIRPENFTSKVSGILKTDLENTYQNYLKTKEDN